LTRQNAVGEVTRQALSPGQVLRDAYLKHENSILAGQQVSVIARGSGFSVVNRGHALNSAARGALIRVKLDNGQVVSGIAGDAGVVDVSSDR
jgi:flagella basal body P-ring formation protein FlgA